jgi:mannose-1-phosphate guanylyltransferase
MIIVIFAGGSGTRLWPLSHGNHPKHLLSLTSDRSMLQNTYDRLRSITPDIYVVTEISHSRQVRDQLPELDDHHIIIEPSRRGTASCIVLALARIGERHDPGEVVVFSHSDHHIHQHDLYASAIRAAAESATAKGAIALVGVTPSHPATGLGYIEYGEQIDAKEDLPVYKVEGFKEKPDLATAKKFLAAGNYLWNQGLFAAPLSVWESEFKTHAPYYYDALLALRRHSGDLPALSKFYLSLENEAIDYALYERTRNLIAVPARYEWTDIGSFFDLHKVLKDTAGADGNVLKGNVKMINCEDCMIHASDKPIIAIGLTGLVVVDTPDGLLVCAKEQAQLVGQLSKKLQAEADTKVEH